MFGWSLPIIALLVWIPSYDTGSDYARAQKATVLVQSDHGSGSGFIVQRGSRVFVWTAAHVVRGCNTLKIHQYIRYENRKTGESVFDAVVIARDSSADLALLWLDAPPAYFSSISFGTGTAPPGTAVYHVGNFDGPAFDGSISTGVISQVGVHPDGIGFPWPVADQMTSLVVPGSSGGAVFNRLGSVIGVVVGNYLPGVEFFVPLRVLEDFVAREHVEWALRGVLCPRDELLKLNAVHAAVVVKETPLLLLPF